MTYNSMIARLVLAVSFLVAPLFFGQDIARQLSGPSSVQPAKSAQASPDAVVETTSPVAPQVLCKDGQVTVHADDSTLASVLKAVATCTGAIVHMPARIGTTRIAAQYGPAAPMDLLAALIGDSADYVIFGSDRPGRVQMVIVRPRQQISVPAQPKQTVAAPPRPKTFVDEEGVERLMSGLTPEEAELSPEELAQKFEAARQEQRRLDELNKQPD